MHNNVSYIDNRTSDSMLNTPTTIIFIDLNTRFEIIRQQNTVSPTASICKQKQNDVDIMSILVSGWILIYIQEKSAYLKGIRVCKGIKIKQSLKKVKKQSLKKVKKQSLKKVKWIRRRRHSLLSSSEVWRDLDSS